MGALVRAEFYRLRHDKSFWALLGIVVAAYMLMLTGGHHLEVPGREVLGNIMGGRAAAAVVIASVYGGLYMGRDFEARTFSLPVETGHSRSSVLLSKAIVFFLAFDALVLFFPALAVAWCTIANGWGAPPSPIETISILGVFAALALLGASIAATALVAACCFRTPGPTVGIPVAIALVQLPLLNSSSALPAAHFLPFCATLYVGDGMLSPVYGGMLGIAWCVVLVSASVLLVWKAELR